MFVGIDVIDGHLTEINVTSPTGMRAIRRLGGPDLAAAIWDVIEAKRRRRLAVGPAEGPDATAHQSPRPRSAPRARRPTCSTEPDRRAAHAACARDARATRWRSGARGRSFPRRARRRRAPRRIARSRRAAAAAPARARSANSRTNSSAPSTPARALLYPGLGESRRIDDPRGRRLRPRACWRRAPTSTSCS